MGKYGRDQLIIASRGSRLALAQTEEVAQRLRTLYPGLEVEVRIVKTRGDQIRDVPLHKVGGKGLFTKALEEVLLAGGADLAVHSLKDLPTGLPKGLCLAAVPRRADPRDALILADSLASRAGDFSLACLPPGARVGTSSLRRRAQLRHLRPDLQLEEVRGNVDTRLRKLDEGQYDALILAVAGLERLGWTQRLTWRLPFEVCTPAVGQGALGLETRADDEEVWELLQPLEDAATRAAVRAERTFLQTLGGGCRMPLGAVAQVERTALVLTAVVASKDGTRLLRRTAVGPWEEAELLGREMAEELKRSGGRWILGE
ncbi:MAG TPA: hydroxymethylbilane synthase [Armatimonadetes bacterium]|nr:hydroxymethylbilane synthase [Armatimonadota bacterium]